MAAPPPAGPAYDVPKWAGKPAPGLHLDVVKDGKLIQKLMIDEKNCYLFGRNPSQCDFCIDHSSCSRVHSALVYHKHLERAFLVDLGSTHGTYIGNIRIESNKPTQLPTDSTFHFGASTRFYTIRERPKAIGVGDGERGEGDHLVLPDDELELDNLTEYNTANNKRINMLGIVDEPQPQKRKKRNVTFKEEEDVINPEDIDPSVGKFRNLVQTSVVQTKKRKAEPILDDRSMHHYSVIRPEPTRDSGPLKSSSSYNPLLSNSMSIKLGIQLPNPTPDINEEEVIGPEPPPPDMDFEVGEAGPSEKKKKYAKEAWPGKKPGLL